MKSQLQQKIAHAIMTDTDLHGIPATDYEIQTAERVLKTKFHAQYIDFIKIFGGASGGIDIHAFKNGSLLGKETVTELTIQFRNTHTANLQDNLKNAYVISNDGSGNPILMTPGGEIYIYLHETGEAELLYNSLEDLLTKSFP